MFSTMYGRSSKSVRMSEAPNTVEAVFTVPDHVGGRPWKINAWFLYTHMVYL